MLIVMGIIVVVALVAVPSFRALTGGRSIEGAQNQLSAAMARARTEAMGLQVPRGILFFRDPDTKRIGLMMVRPATGNTAAPWNLDLAPDRDSLLLPAGVGVQAIASNPINDRYLGYISYDSRTSNPTPEVHYGSVVLFDGQGRVIVDPYRLATRVDPDGTGPLTYVATEMGKWVYANPSLAAGTAADANLPTDTSPAFTSSVGVVLFDEDAFTGNNTKASGYSNDADTDFGGQAFTTGPNGAYAPEETAEETWLDQNSTPVLVNRYNGTLVRSQ
jgi:Tfp pilus assembly protein FimT